MLLFCFKYNTLKSIANYLQTDVCNDRVIVLCGAGISTSAGIPDFRSPDTGLYANLAKLNLPYPEAVFDIHYFQLNPQPFYTLARDIAPGKFIPTPTHAFIKLLHEKGKLSKCFTQNIDTLERIAGVPPDKIVEAHGSFAASRCITCKTPYDNNQMKEDIRAARVPYCPEPECEGLVKPDIVFFGEGLPPEFAQGLPTIQSAALVIVMGTSLKVHPFALLPNLVPSRGCPRLLLNLEPAGNIGISLRQELRAVSQANNPSGRASPPASPSPSPDQREGSPASTARHGDPLSVPQGTGTVGDNVPAGGAHDLDRQSPAEAAQARTNANVNVTKKEEAIPGGAPLDSEDQDVQWDDEEYEEVDEDDEDEDEWGEDELGGVWLDDVVHLGPCDKSVRELCDLLGWRDELERIWKEGGGREPQKAGITVHANTGGNDGGGSGGAPLENLDDAGETHGSTPHKDQYAPDHIVPSEETAKKAPPNQSDAVEGLGNKIEPVSENNDNSVEKTLQNVMRDLEETLKVS